MPYNFDFNRERRSHKDIARSVAPAALGRLFAALHAADERFRQNARDGALDALRAVCFFLDNSEPERLLSRPLHSLVEELKQRPTGDDKRRILPITGSGSGGVNARENEHRIKAAAAFAVELLHKTGVPVKVATGQIAETLVLHDFPFGKHRTDKALAVFAWRRDYRRKKTSLRPAAVYHGFETKAPVALNGSPGHDRFVIRAWFKRELARNGYEAQEE